MLNALVYKKKNSDMILLATKAPWTQLIVIYKVVGYVAGKRSTQYLTQNRTHLFSLMRLFILTHVTTRDIMRNRINCRTRYNISPSFKCLSHLFILIVLFVCRSLYNVMIGTSFFIIISFLY